MINNNEVNLEDQNDEANDVTDSDGVQGENTVNVSTSWRNMIKRSLADPPSIKAVRVYRPNACGSVSPKTVYRANNETVGKDKFKVCIDVSGAVSQEEVDAILKTIAINLKGSTWEGAELICWSDTLDCIKSFRTMHDKVDMGVFKGKEGCVRDMRSLLKYLSKKGEVVNGFKSTTQPNFIELILIVTDGKLDVPEELQTMSSIKKKIRWLVVGDDAELFAAKVQNCGKVFKYVEPIV